MTVTDNMVNLIAPAGGWNVQYNGSALSLGGGVNQYQITGSVPNQTMTVNLSTTKIAPGGGGHLTYQAQTPSTIANFSGNIARFQNSFSVNYNGGTINTGGTPLLPFFLGKSPPVIKEVQ